MARTRDASARFVQLDRQGVPISPSAAFLKSQPSISGHVVLKGPGAEPVPVPQPIIGYRADSKSWSRNMEAHELAQLVAMVLGNFVVNITPEEYAKLSGDVRRHFMAVRGVEPPKMEEKAVEVPEKKSLPPFLRPLTEEEAAEKVRLHVALVAKGVTVDGRWGLKRLREELEFIS